MYTFNLTVTEIATGKIVFTAEFKGYSNTEMMDEMKELYRTKWPRDKFRIDW